MRVTEEQAKKKWCPFVRIEGSNRLLDDKSSGFDAEHMLQHCIGTTCMAWRPFQFTHVKGTEDEAFQHHGYCGLAGRPELGD